MPADYVERVHSETPTRFWVNNPAVGVADKAIGAGAGT